MMSSPEVPDSLHYVIGAERRLKDVLRTEDVAPLLQEALKTGIHWAAVDDDNGETLWSSGDEQQPEAGDALQSRPLYLEGEPVGTLRITGDVTNPALLNAVADLLGGTLTLLSTANLKRMLTAELHTTVVSQSYEELLAAHHDLQESEARYRELAETLEKRVEQRTAELQRAYSRLLQNEKMAAVGQLAAGVAHEINNPIGFVTSNLQTLRKYVGRFIEMLDFSRTTLVAQLPDPETFHRKWHELKLDFVKADVPELLRQSLEGTERVKRIVADLKGFSHIDESERNLVDINRELERTLEIMARTLPESAEIVKDLQPLPTLVCNGSLLCQVFMNIIMNAGQAQPENLRLRIATRYRDGLVHIVFADNGPGIPEEIRGRIFEPFFTTRDVGQGTGMGLTVAYDIITAMGGDVEVACPDGGGSTFAITLPLQEG